MLRLVKPGDTELIGLLAGWYQDEWNLPVSKMRERLTGISSGPEQFHGVMYIDGLPVATGGIHHHVGLCDREPRFAQYRHWMAMVYTLPQYRNKGIGAVMCHYLQEHSRAKGIGSLYLFTDTAERLYHRLGWSLMERVDIAGRNIAVMHMHINAASCL